MFILSKVNYRLDVIPIKIPVALFAETEKKLWNLNETTRDPKESKQSWENAVLAEGGALVYSCGGMSSGAATVENSREVPQEIKHRTTM